MDEQPKENDSKNEEQLAQVRRQRLLSALRFAKPGAVVFVTLAGYLTGVVYYQTYLKEFQIDSRTFPVDAPGYWVYGASALYELLPSLNGFAAKMFWGVAAFVMLCLLVERAALNREPTSRIARCVKAVSRARLVFAPIITIPLVAVLIMSPLIVGKGGAQATFEADSKDYSGGCEHPSGGSLCSKLYDQDKLLAQGFVIVASPDQVALYRDGTTTILDLKGRRLVTEGQQVRKKGQSLQKPPTSIALPPVPSE
ncbi:hypothetical protein SAMN05446927_5275 [Caballeronia arationis]|uniref:Uncharacterized protein n=1 Tax=Caballeronia arationis TaxID=1777142 RepID=A0A7Z7N5B3_9BURK|nr:hypothetical protein [Caballeronia arationis]SOE81972.1 hypothetical protein SAMN05446927_5275 [Caballeronia arationis]